MPALIQEHQEKVTVTKLNVVYSLLSQAVDRMIEDQGATVNEWGSTPASRIQKFKELLPKYVEIVRECDSYIENQYNQTNCLGDVYVGVRLKEKADWARHIFDNGRYVLKNGSTLVINGGSKCVQNFALTNTGGGDNVAGVNYQSYNTTCIQLSVDINGPSKPNKLGVDYFTFYVYRDGLGPAGRAQETVWTETFSEQCLGKGVNKYSLREAGCSAWVIYNKNMDYLHCPEKLGWDKASSCK